MNVCDLTSHYTTSHFGDESFQAIDCTGTDNQEQGNKTYTYTLNTKGNGKVPLLGKQNT